jgi:hypothetical protein
MTPFGILFWTLPALLVAGITLLVWALSAPLEAVPSQLEKRENQQVRSVPQFPQVGGEQLT